MTLLGFFASLVLICPPIYRIGYARGAASLSASAPEVSGFRIDCDRCRHLTATGAAKAGVPLSQFDPIACLAHAPQAARGTDA
jgi:hypothetical protein